MLHVFIHIGTHKTGSTSLQAFLAQNRSVLGRFGYLFPKTHATDHGNHTIAWQLREGDESGLTHLIRQAETTGMSNLILSSEDFELLRDLRQIKAATKKYATSVIAYLRPQLSYIESEYNQVAKMLPSRFYGSVEDLVSQPQYAYRFDYAQLLEPWSEAFGIPSINVRPFESRQLCENLYSDFLVQLCMPSDAIGEMDYRVAKRNLSLRYEPLQLLLSFNRFPLADSLHMKLVDALQQLGGSRKHVLSRQFARKLADRFALSNQEVADKYLKRDGEPLFLEPAYADTEVFEDPVSDRPAAIIKAISQLQERHPELLEQALASVSALTLQHQETNTV